MSAALTYLGCLLVVGVASAALDWPHWPAVVAVAATSVLLTPPAWAAARRRGVRSRSEQSRGSVLLGVAAGLAVVLTLPALPDRWWGLYVVGIFAAVELVWRAMWRRRDRSAGAARPGRPEAQSPGGWRAT
jgi:hypothetical protein